MFLRCNRRKKDGKTHDYWSVVENRRCSDGRVVQRQALYLGQFNASQREAWRKTIEVQDAGTRRQWHCSLPARCRWTTSMRSACA